MTSRYTILVNSSDGYSDCWGPFFTLFDRYWPECPARVLLNTEMARFDGKSRHHVESTRVQAQMARRLTWGECVQHALSTVETPLVLYLQEDYFLERPVNTIRLGALVEQMLRDPTIAQVGLTSFGAYGPFHPTEDPSLWEVDVRSPYRTSLQAALWRTDVLRSYIRPDENGWMFEIYGTRRSWRRAERFLTVARDLERDERVFPYSHAGIVKGQWDAEVPAFFAREGIEMDFSKRGFFRPRPPLLEKFRTARKLLEHPTRFVRGMMGR